MNGPNQYKVGVWHKNQSVREQIVLILRKHNFVILGEGVNGKAFYDWAISNAVDLVIVAAELDELDGITALLRVAGHKAIPAIVVAPTDALASIELMMADHIMSFLSEPVRQAEILPNAYLVLRRFAQMQRLKDELSTFRNTLSELKICYAAKVELMQAEVISEPIAHQKLQRMATDNRIRLVEAARRILEDMSGTKTR